MLANLSYSPSICWPHSHFYTSGSWQGFEKIQGTKVVFPWCRLYSLILPNHPRKNKKERSKEGDDLLSLHVLDETSQATQPSLVVINSYL